MFRKWLSALVIVTALPMQASAEDSATNLDTQWDRFKLWAECNPVTLEVFVQQDEKAKSIDADSIDAIEVAVRSRLRSARLFKEDDSPVSNLFQNGALLNLSIHLFDSAHTIRLSLHKIVTDTISGENYIAPTWQISLLGMRAKKQDYIDTASNLTDQFIDEYLRVNEPACISAN